MDLESAKAGIGASTVSVADDFGQRATIDIKSIHGFMLEDMEQSKLAHIERGLHQARTQARAQQMATADPVLKNAAMIGMKPKGYQRRKRFFMRAIMEQHKKTEAYCVTSQRRHR